MAKINKETKNGSTERRKSDRLFIPLQVSYKLLPRKHVLHQAFSQDISGGGIRLSLNFPLKKGEKLRTFIHLAGDPKPVAAFSKVIWCTKKPGKDDFDVGVQHVRIDPKDKERFVFLFCEMMINYFIEGKAKISLEEWAKKN
jgi:c-di-GMP-binding flagellar brake protein YcgR